jgi:hypothetical protein
MKETVQFFRALAKRHRELANELHQEEVIRDLHRLAEDCDAKADQLTKRLAAEEAALSRPRRTVGHR